MGEFARRFVASLPRPGGNVTGFIAMEGSVAGKWLELLKELAPRVNRVAFLFNPATGTYAEYFLNPFKAAAASFGVEAIVAPARDVSELESVVAAQARELNSGLIVMPDSFTMGHSEEITLLAARYRLPAVYPYRIFAELGGLLSYGNDRRDNFRSAAIYAEAHGIDQRQPVFQNRSGLSANRRGQEGARASDQYRRRLAHGSQLRSNPRPGVDPAGA